MLSFNFAEKNVRSTSHFLGKKNKRIFTYNRVRINNIISFSTTRPWTSHSFYEYNMYITCMQKKNMQKKNIWQTVHRERLTPDSGAHSESLQTFLICSLGLATFLIRLCWAERLTYDSCFFTLHTKGLSEWYFMS